MGVIGPNGCGKTTFLRILAGELCASRGAVRLGASLDVGYYRQEGEDLTPQKTIVSEVHDLAPREDLEAIRSICGRFGFTDDEQLKTIEVLSGGERARVSLAKLFVVRPNLLLLDEPTNHLDVASRELLEAALAEYKGTLVAVSHDRYFLDRITDRILAFGVGQGPSGVPRLFLGGYTDFRERCGRERAEPRGRPVTAGRSEGGGVRASESAQRAQHSPGTTSAPGGKRSRRNKPKKRYTLEELEERIIAAEERQKEVEAELAAPSNVRDQVRIALLSEEFASLKAVLEDLEAEWELWT
ncbi:ATP-binding cassette domain-containing protein [Planctomycetota bacterium]